MPPPKHYYKRFGETAQAGALYELHLRLLADKVEATRGVALARNLEDVERAVVTLYAGVLTKPECEALEKSRRVRNKLLHAEFHSARDLLLELGLNPPCGLVQAVDLRAGSVVTVSDTDTAGGRIYGWLLECEEAGLFEAAGLLFDDATRAIFRLMDHVDRVALADAE